MNPRPKCEKPDACVAKGAGHCKTCVQRGRKQTLESIKKKRAAMLGKKHTPESIEKMRAAKLGKPLSPKALANRRAIWAARKTPEICIPAWIPERLREDYAQRAEWSGEFEAAAHYRKVLQKMRAS